MPPKAPKPPKPDDHPASPRIRRRSIRRGEPERTLRNIAKTIPDGDRVLSLLVGLYKPHGKEIGASDRYAAIVGTALLEYSLKAAISTHLTSDNESRIRAQKELFDDYERSPLASFSSRIKAAYALGIIDDTSRYNLDIIRIIRNSFAHSIETIEFGCPECEREINKMVFRGSLQGIMESWSPRMKFSVIAFTYYHALINYSLIPIAKPPPIPF